MSDAMMTESLCEQRQHDCLAARSSGMRWLIGVLVGVGLTLVTVGAGAALTWVQSARAESARDAGQDARIKALEHNLEAQEARIDTRLIRIEDKLDQALEQMRQGGR